MFFNGERISKVKISTQIGVNLSLFQQVMFNGMIKVT